MRSPAATATVSTTTELVETAHAALRGLAALPAPESGAATMELSERLASALDLGETALAAMVEVTDRAAEPSRWRYAGTRGWLKVACWMRTGRAVERVTVARQLPRLPRVAALSQAGKLSFGYTSTICEAVAQLSDEDCAKAQDILLGAVADGLSPTKVANLGARIKDVINVRDDNDSPGEDAARGTRSWWRVSRSLGGGGAIKGWFDPELLALVNDRLGPLTKPAGPEDDRDHAQRMADALGTVLAGGGANWNATLVVKLTNPPGADTAPGNPIVVRGNARTSASPPSPGDTGNPNADHSGRDEDRGDAPTKNSRKQHADNDPRAAPIGDHAHSSRPLRNLGNKHHRSADRRSGRDGTSTEACHRQRAPGSPPIAPNSDGAQHSASTDERHGEHDRNISHDCEDRHDGEGMGGRSGDGPNASRKGSALPTSGGGVKNSGHTHGGGQSAGRADHRFPAWPMEAARVSARLADGTPIEPWQARILALNAGVSALILGSDGIPLYLGRKSRFVTPHQRQVLEALYETCAADECDIPARLCQLDHVFNWVDDSTTDIDLIAPACAFHNRLKDQRPDWVTTTRDQHGRWRYRIRRPRPRWCGAESKRERGP